MGTILRLLGFGLACCCVALLGGVSVAPAEAGAVLHRAGLGQDTAQWLADALPGGAPLLAGSLLGFLYLESNRRRSGAS